MLADAMFLRMRAMDGEECPGEEPIVIGKGLTKKWMTQFRTFCHDKGGLLPPKPLEIKEVVATKF